MIRHTLFGIAVAGMFATSAFAATDAFAASTVSRKIVQLGDDVVVVSLVDAAGRGTADNLGIARYDASGQAVGWSQRTSWTDASGQHIVFPNSAWHFTAIRDVQVHKDTLWILVDATHADPAGHVVRKADLLAFDTDGRFKGGRFGVIAADGSRDVIGAGMVFQSSATAGEDRLLVAAACPDLAGGAEDRLCVQHYRISTTVDGLPAVVADGAHRADNWSLKTARATP